MGSWVLARWRLFIGAALVLVLVGVGLYAVVRPALDSANTADCTSLTADTFERAASLAGDCDTEVEILGERTAWQSSFVLPDRLSRLEVSSVPVRTDVTGEWTDLDTELNETSDGLLEVSAPVYPTTLNAGGVESATSSLGSIEKDGHRLAVSFPAALPAADVDGNRAFYDLAPGVRLIVTISSDGTGFTPVVELADAAAAETFAALLDEQRSERGLPGSGIQVPFQFDLSDGLSLQLDDAGGAVINDDQGEGQFFVAPPIMWDSAGELLEKGAEAETGQYDRLSSPAGDDRIAAMPLTVEGDSVVISPDTAMLADPSVVWPVYIDPNISGRTASHRVQLRTGAYTATVHNWGDMSSSSQGQGAGRCTTASSASCNQNFTSRLGWHFGSLGEIGNITGGEVMSAQFRVNGVSSFNCTDSWTDLFRLSGVNGGSTWGNTGWDQHISSRNEAFRSGQCGSPGYREFDATAALRWTADANTDWVALGLKASDEGNMTGWKRWRDDATVSVTYNRNPNVPGDLRLTDPATGCATGGSRPYILSTRPILSAVTSDPDGGNVATRFEVSTTGNAGDVKWTSGWAYQANGARNTAQVPANILANDGTYSWRAQAGDGIGGSAWSGYCEFVVDTVKPNSPTVTPDPTGAAVYPRELERGGVGQQGKFILDRAGSADTTTFLWGFNNTATPSTGTPDSSGKLTISYTPTVSGPITLTVKARDRAGNVSNPTTYKFDVATPTEDGIWKLDEGTGTTSAETTGRTPARPLTISGAVWSNGPHQLFGSRANDRALTFDGVDDAAVASGQVLDTKKSFTVSAHVWLDPTKVGTNASYTALAQDGSSFSGFRLGYAPSCGPTTGSGCWSFSMPNAAGAATATSVNSSSPVIGGQWVHLVGEHDATAKTLRIWTCNIGTPEAPAPGEPIRSNANRTATAWSASGPLTVGRAQASAVGTQWWPGAIDNVRIFSGQVVTEAKIRRLCQGAEAGDFSNGDAALDPTVAGQ